MRVLRVLLLLPVVLVLTVTAGWVVLVYAPIAGLIMALGGGTRAEDFILHTEERISRYWTAFDAAIGRYLEIGFRAP